MLYIDAYALFRVEITNVINNLVITHYLYLLPNSIFHIINVVANKQKNLAAESATMGQLMLSIRTKKCSGYIYGHRIINYGGCKPYLYYSLNLKKNIDSFCLSLIYFISMKIELYIK